MSQADSHRLTAHVRLVAVIECLKVARDREAEKVAMLALLVAELSAVPTT